MKRLHTRQEQISQRDGRGNIGLAKMAVTQRGTKMLSGVEFESVSYTAHHISFLNQINLVHLLILLSPNQYKALLPSDLKFCT